jgi:hypothetical protein
MECLWGIGRRGIQTISKDKSLARSTRSGAVGKKYCLHTTSKCFRKPKDAEPFCRISRNMFLFLWYGGNHKLSSHAKEQYLHINSAVHGGRLVYAYVAVADLSALVDVLHVVAPRAVAAEVVAFDV